MVRLFIAEMLDILLLCQFSRNHLLLYWWILQFNTSYRGLFILVSWKWWFDRYGGTLNYWRCYVGRSFIWCWIFRIILSFNWFTGALLYLFKINCLFFNIIRSLPNTFNLSWFTLDLFLLNWSFLFFPLRSSINLFIY